MKTLQLFYECWLEVTKQERYHHKWLTDETYFRAIKAQFPTVESLGFDRGKLNREILTQTAIHRECQKATSSDQENSAMVFLRSCLQPMLNVG